MAFLGMTATTGCIIPEMTFDSFLFMTGLGQCANCDLIHAYIGLFSREPMGRYNIYGNLLQRNFNLPENVRRLIVHESVSCDRIAARLRVFDHIAYLRSHGSNFRRHDL